MRGLIPQDMKLGAWVSGVGHSGLFLWLIIGGFFVAQPDLTDVSVTDVSIVSAEEFAALQPSSPEISEQPPAIQQAEIEEAPATPEIAEPEPVAPQPEESAPEALPEPLPEPDVPVVIDDTVPVSPEPPEEATAPEVEPDATPVPTPAPRVAPEATPEPEPNVVIDPVEQAPTAPSEDATEVQEAQEATAPEAAAEEIITEADDPVEAAPIRSTRPATRPNRPPPVQEVAEEQPEVPGLQESIADAVAEANNPQPVEDNANPGAGSGPPITSGEKESFILAIRQCWNVGALSSDALQVTVIIGVAMNPDGRPDAGSIQMISSDGGSNAAVKQAYEAGRRAIIRCGSNGYDLPKDKYAQWRDVQITFNPERMRIK